MAFNMYWLLSVLLVTSQLRGTEAVVKGHTSVAAHLVEAEESVEDKPEVHIVYMGGVSELTTTNNADTHLSILVDALGSTQLSRQSILYSYTQSFNGFAAVFSGADAEKLRGTTGVVSVFKQQLRQLQTTGSWTYLGLDPTSGIWNSTGFGNDTIIGVLDTGIWPENPSFNDDGFGPIPSKWNGSCEKGEQFNPNVCNKKLIGAKYFSKGFGVISPPEINSARDAAGHGTHTTSTASGRRVSNASFEGVANGTASGGAPSSRLAMYKVCWFEACADADILAGFEAAIADGVDILSLSLGGFPQDYYLDTIAIGAYHATEKGIIVNCAAGNAGPTTGTVSNAAPWIFTVAASSIDRLYESNVEFPSISKSVQGLQLNTYDMETAYPIVYGGDIGDEFCENIDPKLVKGNIIVCAGSGGTPDLVTVYGAVGYVSLTDQDLSVAFYETNVSNTNVNSNLTDQILGYINATKNPVAIVHKTVAVYNVTEAPIVAFFSSVGPNTVTPDTLKPDISAPGVDIIASWPPSATSTPGGDTPYPAWNIISGTSMATPHVTGVTALVKAAHPDWSPAAIKSAIMTTATPFNTSIPGNFELASGAGQINPNRAADPGLIFDLNTTDYVNFLCAIGYNDTIVDLITGGKETCPSVNTTVLDTNLPSIYISSNITVGTVYTIPRTVTEVAGNGSSEYTLTVVTPTGVDLTVSPTTLSFNETQKQQTFIVTANITSNIGITENNFGSITWTDGDHVVRIVIGIGQQY